MNSELIVDDFSNSETSLLFSRKLTIGYIEANPSVSVTSTILLSKMLTARCLFGTALLDTKNLTWSHKAFMDLGLNFLANSIINFAYTLKYLLNVKLKS